MAKIKIGSMPTYGDTGIEDCVPVKNPTLLSKLFHKHVWVDAPSGDQYWSKQICDICGKHRHFVA